MLAQCININPEYCKNHLSINIQLSSLRHPLSRDFLSLVELATCREAASLRSPAKGLPYVSPALAIVSAMLMSFKAGLLQSHGLLQFG